MRSTYEQTYVPYVDITIIMKTTYDENNEQIKYELSGYYFGEPNIVALDTFKNDLGNKMVKMRNEEIR